MCETVVQAIYPGLAVVICFWLFDARSGALPNARGFLRPILHERGPGYKTLQHRRLRDHLLMHHQQHYQTPLDTSDPDQGHYSWNEGEACPIEHCGYQPGTSSAFIKHDQRIPLSFDDLII